MAEEKNWWANDPAVETPDAPEATAPALAAEGVEPPAKQFYENDPIVAGNPVANEIAVNDISRATDEALSRVQYTPPESNTFAGWAGRVGRAMTFGVSDTISAKLIQKDLQRQDPTVTYEEVLGAVRQGYAEDVSMSAEIVGSLTPGTAVAKGLAGVTKTAQRAGVLKGTLTWLSKDKVTSRIANASVAGAGIGATYEAIRTGVDQSVGALAGEEVNLEEVVDAGIQGAVVGALLGPVANEAARGIGGVVSWVKQATGNTDEAVMKATQRIARAVAKDGEDADQAVIRLRTDAANFTRENGRPPALFEILSPDKAKEVSDVVRYYTGLSPRLQQLTDDQIMASIKTFERRAAGTKPFRDKEQVEAWAENQFTNIMRNNGDTMVDVGDEAFEALADNPGFLSLQAKHNPEARALLGTIEARSNVVALRQKVGKLANSKNIADEAKDLADLQVEISTLVDEAFQKAKAGAGASELAELRNLEQVSKALLNQHQKAVQSGYAQANRDNMVMALRAAEDALADYAENGFKVTLRSANAMRANASRSANNSNDLNAQAEAIAVRDALSKVGIAEVPAYGRMVKTWNREMTRAEAQATGREAVTGAVTPENLAVRADQGRIPGKPRAANPADVRKGIEEGARVELRQGTTGTPGEAARAAERLSTSPRVQKTVEKAIPKEGKQIIKAAEQVSKTVENARKATGSPSPTLLQDEMNSAKEAFETMFVGNIGGGIGGAAMATLGTKFLMRFKIPRKTAEQIVDMLGDPNRIDDALSYLQKRRINIGGLATVMANAQADAENTRREARKK